MAFSIHYFIQSLQATLQCVDYPLCFTNEVSWPQGVKRGTQDLIADVWRNLMTSRLYTAQPMYIDLFGVSGTASLFIIAEN